MKPTFEKLFKLITPKAKPELISSLADGLARANEVSAEHMEKVFQDELLYNRIAVLFYDNISLDNIVFKLKTLILDNNIDVPVLSEEMDENEGTDNMLQRIAKMFRKKGWALADVHQDPKVYHLVIVPETSKNELKEICDTLKLYIQFF